MSHTFIKMAVLLFFAGVDELDPQVGIFKCFSVFASRKYTVNHLISVRSKFCGVNEKTYWHI